jgi:hypothetical protein
VALGMTEEMMSPLQAAQKQIADLSEGLAATFVGRTCPLKNGAACDGPKCMWFAAFDDNPDSRKPNRVTNGTCSYLLSAQQLNQMNMQIGELARAMGNFALAQGPRLLKPQ